MNSIMEEEEETIKIHPNHNNINKKRKKNQTPLSKFRSDLDSCSRNKDLTAAISLFDAAISSNLPLTLHHFNSLLYVCSNSVPTSLIAAVDHGFRLFNHLISVKVDPNEATIATVAKLAAAKGDGDMAFELAKSLGEKYRGSPKLRTYVPALLCFCRNLEAEKAYEVDGHIVKLGLQLEEAEIAALLKVSGETGRGEKVYEYLHRLRLAVRCVSECTREAVENWFCRGVGCEVGRAYWDENEVRELVLRNGGGWHGMGWLGKGKWVVERCSVGPDGHCDSCGEQLACVDIGRAETEKFAQSVASLAMEREVHSNFSQFQSWLDEHSEFEAIVDGANIGLYQQNFAEGGFCMSQLAAVVKELYSRNKKWPLVVLHEKRVQKVLEDSSNRELLEEWMDQGVLYGTPYGSNDDWYWIYASVKLKCLLVTNDEMRDHSFELLGSNFFLKWKERHQVRYTFVKAKLKLQMPPSYSLVIQESEKGAWHVPITDEQGDESSKKWLCIIRRDSRKASDEVTGTVDIETSGTVQSLGDHIFLKRCKAGSVLTESNGNSDSVHLIDSSATATIEGKIKERSPSPS